MKITIDTAQKTIEVHGRASAEDVQRFLDLLADSSWAADLSEWEMIGRAPNDSGTTAQPSLHFLSGPNEILCTTTGTWTPRTLTNPTILTNPTT